jgi:hypothetical protein
VADDVGQHSREDCRASQPVPTSLGKQLWYQLPQQAYRCNPLIQGVKVSPPPLDEMVWLEGMPVELPPQTLMPSAKTACALFTGQPDLSSFHPARETSAIVGYRRRAASSESTADGQASSPIIIGGQQARRAPRCGGGDAPTVVAGGMRKCPLY